LAVPRLEFIRTSQFDHAQAAVWNDRLELAGQGGWYDDFGFPTALADEIAQAFRNVDAILRLAGATWDQVIGVVSYHVDLAGNQDLVNQTMGQQFQKYTPNAWPTWTCLGVAALGSPKMRVEIRASAVAPT
jgi:enamine deaminase RidA (YjgF/YER057c/UK114 family)